MEMATIGDIKVTSSYETIKTIQNDFDKVDSRKRVIGCKVVIGTETRTEAEKGYYISNWVGCKFWAIAQATRNGELFGASQRRNYFDTMEQAEKFAVDYIAKRAR